MLSTMLHVFRFLRPPTVRIIQQLIGDQGEEVASVTAQNKRGKIPRAGTPILVAVAPIAVMMEVWIGVIGIQVGNGTGIGTKTGAGLWESSEDLMREKESGPNSSTVCLHFGGPD